MKSKRLARMAIGAAVVAVSLASPTPSWAADEPAAAAAKKPSQAQWEELDKVAKKHSAFGVFGVTSDSGPVLTLPAGASADEKVKVVAEVPDGIQVTVKTSKFTKNEVDKIQKGIGEAKWHKDAKKYGLGAFYDGEKDTVVVNTDAPESIREALKNSYGDKIQVVQSRFEQQATRFDDYERFYGGASIHNNHGTCTAGWKIRAVNPDNGQSADMLTTAGHCFLNNELVQNSGSNRWMGWVKRFGGTYGGGDLEAFVGYQYSNHIYTGGYYSSTSNMQTGSLSGMYTGLHVCVSGQTTYNHCGHPIASTNYGFSWYDRNGHSHYNNSADGFTYNRGGTNNNGTLTAAGDSGAPVHVPHDQYTTSATGSHSGLVSWYEGACGCTQYRMYGVKAQFVHDKWGGSVSTS